MAEQILVANESLDADIRVTAAVRNVRSVGGDERALVPVDEITEVGVGAVWQRQKIVGHDLLRGCYSGAAEQHRRARRKQYMPGGRSLFALGHSLPSLFNRQQCPALPRPDCCIMLF